MAVDTRRASAFALAILAIVAVAFVVRNLSGRTPLPPETTAPSSTSAPATDVSRAADQPSADYSSYDRDLDLAGIIVDPDGAPIAGATVQAVFHPARTSAPREASPVVVLGPETRSGVGGTFAIRLLRGQRAGLRVDAAGFAPCEHSPATAGSRVRVVMRPAVACVVTLRDADGRPVAGRPVFLEHRVLHTEVLLHRRTLSDAEGRARFEGLPGGLVVTPGSYSDRHADVALPLRGTLELDVTVPHGRTVRGRVTDRATGLPIPGAQVSIRLPGVETETTTAEADGRYSLHGVPEPAVPPSDDDPRRGALTIRVTADGYATAPAAVAAGSVHDVSLESATFVTGRVVDGGGRPIAAAWVFIESVGWFGGRSHTRPKWDLTPAAITDTEGRFRIATQTRYEDLLVEAVGFAPLAHRMQSRTDSAQHPVDVGDLVLRPGLMLEGHVFDGEGRPMPGARLRLDDETCTSDDLGRYRVRDLAPGHYRLQAAATGRDQLQRNVTLSPDRDPTVLDLIFPAGREVTFEVRDPSGVPVVGAGLSVVDRPIWVSTDTQGRGAVIVPAGAWKAQVTAGMHRHADRRPVFVECEAVIPADATHIAVTLHRTPLPEEMFTIAGTVVDDEGRPADGVLLSVTGPGLGDASRRAEHLRSAADGAFTLRVPPGAACDIRVDARIQRNRGALRGPATDPWEGELTRVPAGRTDVVIVARPRPWDRTVTVLVLSPDGDPLDGVSLEFSGTANRRTRALTGKEGRAEFSGLVRESCSVAATPPEGRRTEWLTMRAPSFVPDGQTITVRLRRAAQIAGDVLLFDGSPARSAYVTFTAGSTRDSEQTDASGRFLIRVDAALPLPWRLTAELGQEWPRNQVFLDLAAPPPADVTLRFPDRSPR